MNRCSLKTQRKECDKDTDGTETGLPTEHRNGGKNVDKRKRNKLKT